jgi:hypothetical protein
MIVMPVALPPGRERLAANPNPTGSPPITNTIGTVDVDVFAATAEFAPPAATKTATGRWISSVANAANRSKAPSANRYSVETVFPSKKPASSNPFPNALTNDPESFADRVLRNPITGLEGCCAPAVSGHAAAAPTSPMNLRRCMCTQQEFRLSKTLALHERVAR